MKYLRFTLAFVITTTLVGCPAPAPSDASMDVTSMETSAPVDVLDVMMPSDVVMDAGMDSTPADVQMAPESGTDAALDATAADAPTADAIAADVASGG